MRCDVLRYLFAVGEIEGSFERSGVPLQECKGLDPVNGEMRLDAAFPIDLQTNVDSPELSGIEANLEVIDPGKAL